MSKNKTEDSKEDFINPKEYAKSFLKTNDKDHFNFVEDKRNSYKISTGSLKFDHITNSGISPGVQLVTGPKESGKTSFILTCIKNLLDNPVLEARGVFIAAERPLSEEMKQRSGIKFVRDPSEWEPNTCFILETNVFETALSFVKGLCEGSLEDGSVYGFVIDSINGLIRKGDIKKTFDESVKVAGGATLLSDFLRRVSLPIGKLGHYLFATAQDRADIKVTQWEQHDRNKLGHASVGNAPPHYAQWAFDFQRVNQSDYILNDDKKIVGRKVRVKFEKTPNDTTGQKIEYPVLFKRWGGKSVWVEREVIDMLKVWEVLVPNGSWVQIEDKFIKYLDSKGVEIPKKIQGWTKVYKFFEESDDLIFYSFEYLKEYY